MYPVQLKVIRKWQIVGITENNSYFVKLDMKNQRQFKKKNSALLFEGVPSAYGFHTVTDLK